MDSLAPMLPTLVDEPPSGPDWCHEVKHDGYRTQIHLCQGEARAFTRNGFDWSEKYACLLEGTKDLPTSSAILDGEVVVQDGQGRTDFAALRSAISNCPENLIFYAFDLLEVGGRNIRKEALKDRRARLADLVGHHRPDRCIQFSDGIIGDGRPLFAAAAEMDLEGIVSKKLTSRYVGGRTRSWLKCKAYAEDEFFVVGCEQTKGPACALLARQTEGGLEYAGSAFVTLGGDERERFWRRMDQLSIDRPAVPIGRRKHARWVSPGLRVRAKFLRGEEQLRHATLCKIAG